MKQALAILFPSLMQEKASSAAWAVKGRQRSQFHWERKFYHCLMGVVCFGLYAFAVTREQALWLLATVGGSFVFCDVVRFRFPKLNSLTLRVFGRVMRREELRSVSGNSFFILGLLTLVLFFPKPIVLLGTLFLAFGDPSAAIFGSLYGKHKLVGKKSVEGALANFFVVGLVTLVTALAYFRLPVDSAILLAVGGACISVVVELIPFPIDDNFTIPVGSAVLLTFFLGLFPLF